MIVLAALLAAQAVTCPVTLQSRPLTAVQVFDGDPKELADLEPDGGRWDLKAIRSTSSPEGFYLVCGYKGDHRLTLRLPKNTDSCRLTGTARAPKAECR